MRQLLVALAFAAATFGAACGGGATHARAVKRQPAPTTATAAETPTTTTQPAPVIVVEPPTTQPLAPTEPPFAGITLDQYNQIAKGMMYPQVVTIVGDSGTLVSQYQRQVLSGIGNPSCIVTGAPCASQYITVTVQVYQWTNNRGGEALITFTDGKSSDMTESGL